MSSVKKTKGVKKSVDDNWKRFMKSSAAKNELVPRPRGKPRRRRFAEVEGLQDAREKDHGENDVVNAKVAESMAKKRKIAEQLLSRKSTEKIVALDCEMIGVGEKGRDSALARVAVVKSDGTCLLDKHVLPQERVTDFRTQWSGIRRDDLRGNPDAISFREAQEAVAKLIDGKIVVGHALKNDFNALLLQHPQSLKRDTALYRPYQRAKGKPLALRVLAQKYLGLEIQKGEHSPIEDAKAALQLYLLKEKDWERWLREMKEKKAEKTREKVLQRGEMLRAAKEETKREIQESSQIAAVAAGWKRKRESDNGMSETKEVDLSRLTRKERRKVLEKLTSKGKKQKKKQ